MGEKTHVFTIHHFGHTRIDFFVTYEVGIELATQASEQLAKSGWKRDIASGFTGVLHHMGTYGDVYTEGAITLRPIETKIPEEK